MRLIEISTLITAIIFAANPTARANDELLAGTAVADITPPIPFRMSGYFNERLSTGTHDPLQAGYRISTGLPIGRARILRHG